MSDNQDIDATLRETYANLRGQFESDFEASAPAPAPAAADPVGPVDPIDHADPVEPVDPTDTDPPQDPEDPQGPAEPVDPEPAQAFKPSWKKAALAEWEKLPPLVRAEVQRREEDFHRGIEQYKTGAAASQEWEKAVQPFMATITGFGVTPQVAVQHLMATDHQLRYAPMSQKVPMALEVLRGYGIDINTLAQGIQQIAGQQAWQEQNPIDPRVQQLQAEVNQMKQSQFQAQQQQVASESSRVDAEIAAFAADPDHEHFPVLQREMGVLLQGGLAKNLDEAYALAMRQNPQTYPIWLAQQQQAWDAERKARVAAAKKSGANNVRPNGRASVPSAPPVRTMEEDLEAKARELGLLN